MTREEAIIVLKRDNPNNMAIRNGFENLYEQRNEAFNIAIKALEQEPNYKSFCEFVAKTIMEEDFELNAGANAEIFCRKLAELGIVRVDGDSWVLESEVQDADSN